MTRFFPLLSLCLAFLLAAPPVGAQTILHVDRSAAAAGDGSSWASPLTSLADALAQATAGDTVRVDQDTYSTAGGFAIPAGVTVRGSFTANTAQPTERDLGPGQKTILSGDVDGDGVGDGRVVDIENHPGPSTPTTLEGFVIKNGAGSGIGDEAGGTAVRTQGENGFSLVKQVEVRDNASDYSVVEVEGNTAILSSVIAKNTTNGPTVAATNWSGIMDRVTLADNSSTLADNSSTLADNSSDTYILGTNSEEAVIKNSLLDKTNSIVTQTVTPVTIDGSVNIIAGDLYDSSSENVSEVQINNGGNTFTVPLDGTTQNPFSYNLTPVGDQVSFTVIDTDGNPLPESNQFDEVISAQDTNLDLTRTAEDRTTWVDEPYHQGNNGYVTMSMTDAQSLEELRVVRYTLPGTDVDGNIVTFDDVQPEIGGDVSASEPGRFRSVPGHNVLNVFVPYTNEEGDDLRDIPTSGDSNFHEDLYDNTMTIVNMMPVPVEVDSTMTYDAAEEIFEDTFFGTDSNNFFSYVHGFGPVNTSIRRDDYLVLGESRIPFSQPNKVISEGYSGLTGIEGNITRDLSV